MAKPGQPIESYDQDPYFLFNPPAGNMRQSDRNASLNQITTYIFQSLIDFQGKWYPNSRGSTVIDMPNARYLAPGDKITNVTTSKTYLITEVIGDAKYSKTIRLDTQGSSVPVMGDVLVLEDKNMVNFVSAYSRAYQDRPVAEWRDTVVWRVVRREPGTVGKRAFEPPSEIKPRVRDYFVDKDHLDSHVAVMGQFFDNLLQFDCWSRYNNSADDLIEWYEDFMYKYTWVWKKNGVNEILYFLRKEDQEVSKWRNDLAVRSVVYYFRTEKIVTLREYDFKQIDLILRLDNTLPSGFYNVFFGSKTPASGSIEIVDLSFHNYT